MDEDKYYVLDKANTRVVFDGEYLIWEHDKDGHLKLVTRKGRLYFETDEPTKE